MESADRRISPSNENWNTSGMAIAWLGRRMTVTACDSSLGWRRLIHLRLRHCVKWCALLLLVPGVALAAKVNNDNQHSSGADPTLRAANTADPKPRTLSNKSSVALPRSTTSGKLGTDLRQIEHSRAKGSNARVASVSGPQASSGSRSRASAIQFRSRSANMRGVNNRLGSGSGTKKSAAGRRINERRR